MATPPQTITVNETVPSMDLRVKISLPPQAPIVFYYDPNNKIQEPLAITGGFIFPIQPQINMGFSASYQETSVTHSNFPFYHYTNSQLKPITLTGEFVIRTVKDAWYVNAGLHFLRSMTRMFTGRDNSLSGMPPMVGRLHGLGFNGFDDLPVVITDLAINFSESVDYVTFPIIPNETGGELTRLPVSFTINVSMNPVFSRDFISKIYNTIDYSTGRVRLIKNSIELYEQAEREQAEREESIRQLPVNRQIPTFIAPQQINVQQMSTVDQSEAISRFGTGDGDATLFST